MLIFGVRRLLSLKNCQMRPQNNFLGFSLKIQLFSKKLSNKKIFSVKFLIKKAIFIFGVRWPLTGRTVTHLEVVPKYLSSDALPEPEIFLEPRLWTPSDFLHIRQMDTATVEVIFFILCSKKKAHPTKLVNKADEKRWPYFFVRRSR